LEIFFERFILKAMQHTLTFLPSDSSEAESSSAFNVLIAYEDFETGKHAKKTYDFLHENLGHECNLTNQMWKFDVLSIPKLREIAVRDAACADIIIISSHGGEFPDPVIKWIESWLMQGTSALALVALFDGDDLRRESSHPMRTYLADVAHRAGVEFFAQPDEWPGRNRMDEALSWRPDSTVSHETLSKLAGAVHREVPIHHWGINE
jgi:hypothetical protein